MLVRDPACAPPPAEDEGVHGSASIVGQGAGVPESAYCQGNPCLPRPRTPTMACEPRFVLGLGGRAGWTWLLGRGGVSKGAPGETAPPFLGERKGQGAGFPEIWGVPPLLKPPSPTTPPLSWNPVPRGGGGAGRDHSGSARRRPGSRPEVGASSGRGFRAPVSRGRTEWVRAPFGWARGPGGARGG